VSGWVSERVSDERVSERGCVSERVSDEQVSERVGE
jgi:hypothetical protein